MPPIARPHRLIDAEIELATRRAQQDLELAKARLKPLRPTK